MITLPVLQEHENNIKHSYYMKPPKHTWTVKICCW